MVGNVGKLGRWNFDNISFLLLDFDLGGNGDMRRIFDDFWSTSQWCIGLAATILDLSLTTAMAVLTIYLDILLSNI